MHIFVCVCVCVCIHYADINNPPTQKQRQNGVDHIHFAMDFAYGSDDMTLAFDTLRPYIDEGKVIVE